LFNPIGLSSWIAEFSRSFQRSRRGTFKSETDAWLVNGGLMGDEMKAFHFMEVDWLIYFPASGNQGKYVGYSVFFTYRKSGTAQPETHVCLGELLDKPEISECYPHTVAYFKTALGEQLGSTPEYLELRIIRCVEEFWAFLNSLDI
jgi:hypothetical protein